MNFFKKKNQSKQGKVLNEIAWKRYLNARSMKDQSLAKQIAEEYGIDYDCFPILDDDTFNKIYEEIERARYYEKQKEMKNAVREVLTDSGLITN